jgi:peptide/nickel transport system permease protein
MGRTGVERRAEIERLAAPLRHRALAERRWSDRSLRLGIVMSAALVLLCLAPIVLGIPMPRQDLPQALQPPSAQHLFGTDSLGRDIFLRSLFAGRTDLVFAVVTTYVSLGLGVLLGSIAGYVGGTTDNVIMRVVDLMVAFPFIVLLLAIAAIAGAGLTSAYIGVLLVGWALFARLARSQMLVLRERQFMLAGQTLGLSSTRIVLRHGIPNIIAPGVVYSMADFVLNILVLASLSYLGLGVQPPTPEWGAMIADGQGYLFTAWWISTMPGLVIVYLGIALSLIGDGLADRLGTDYQLSP